MNKKNIIIGIISIIALLIIGFIVIDNDLLDDFSDLFSNNTSKVTVKSDKKVKKSKFRLFGPRVSIKKNESKSVEYQTYNNGLFSMKIPKGWVVGVANTDYIHYTFMAYNPSNPDYKIYFNMKTEGYLKTQKMRDFYKRLYPSAPFAKLPVINPQTTEGFYRVFTQALLLEQNRLPFKAPVIKNFTPVQMQYFCSFVKNRKPSD